MRINVVLSSYYLFEIVVVPGERIKRLKMVLGGHAEKYIYRFNITVNH
jgi:hypothetical protein